MSSYRKNIVGGVFWTTIQTVVNNGFNLIIQFFLARILFPEDYGIIGMATVFIAFIEVFNDMGMNAALIQRKEDEINPLHFDTVFWTVCLWSLILYLLFVFIGSPLIASFYNQPILLNILPVLSLTLILSTFNSIHRAQLIRDMNFKKTALISNISNIISGVVALGLAFSGYGVWSLVYYTILRSLISIPLFFYATKWVPKLRWGKKEFKDVFSFGVFTTGTNLFNKLTANIDYLLVGKLLGPTPLGLYTFAFMWTNIVRNHLVSIVNKVLYPVYAKLQDDKEKMLELFLKIISINNFIVYPVILGLLLFAENVIPIFFGAKWDNAIPIMKILCIAVFIQMLNNSHTVLFRAAGEVKLEMTLQIIKSSLFFVPLITLGVIVGGVHGAAWGYTLATTLGVTLSIYFMIKKFGLKLLDTFDALKLTIGMLTFCLVTTELVKLILPWQISLAYYVTTFLLIYYFFGKDKIALFRSIIKKIK